MNMKRLVFFAISSLVLIQSGWGQTNPYGLSDADGREVLSFIKQSNLVRDSLAYRSVQLSRMLGEVNFFAERLKLPTPHPIQVSGIQEYHISPPWYSGLDASLKNTNILSPIDRIRAAKVTVMGAIQTTNFAFAFRNGFLWNVVRLHEPAMNPENFDKLVGAHSLVDDKKAYQLAAQWLSAVSVDVQGLEKKCKPQISQQSFYYPKGTTNIVLLPIYFVQWGECQMQQSANLFVKVTILGTSKELMELQLQGDKISNRPQLIITNAFELCSVPDPQIKKSPYPLSKTNGVNSTNSP